MPFTGSAYRSSQDVDVIIPIFNGARVLSECLDSVCSQSLPPCRIIVVDDGSDDDSCTMVKSRYPSVELIRRSENGGFCAAVNTVAISRSIYSFAMSWRCSPFTCQ